MPISAPATRCAARSATRSGPAAAVACALVCAVLAAVTAPAATLDLTGPAGTAIKVNGLDLGTLPLARPLTLGPGAYLIEGELRGFVSFAQTVRLTDDSDQVALHLRLDRRSRQTAWTSSVLYAGLGQFYLDKPVRGWFYVAAESAGLLTALAGELQRSNYRRDFLVLQDSYDSTINGDEALYYREQADQAYANMEDAEKLRNTGLLVALGAITVSVLDALITFPNVDAGPGPVPPMTGYAPDLPTMPGNPLTTVHAAVKLTF